MQHHEHKHSDKPASVKNIEKAKPHGCADACPGCQGFFRSLVGKASREKYILMQGGVDNTEKIINGKAKAMLKANPKGSEVFGEATAVAFDKYLKAAGIEGGIYSPLVGLEIKEDKQTKIDKAALKYIAASKGRHWE